MIKIENVEVMGFEGAIRGMRNAMESWDKADSGCGCNNEGNSGSNLCKNCHYKSGWCERSVNYIIGLNDLKLAQKLISAGAGSHRKFLRQIYISFDITSPIYWNKELDTYKIGTVRNSTSTMHKLATTPITNECFSFDGNLASLFAKDDTPYDYTFCDMWESVLNDCEQLRLTYLKTKDIRYWRVLIQLLPESWNQMSTYSCNYEVLRTMYFDRRNHKLQEWKDFCAWIETLPYAKELITYKGDIK